MITAAVDGSALSNPGPAGWAWYIDDENWQAGGWPSGTNNMGELQAVLSLLRATASAADQQLRILCDSQYVINSLTKWLPGWKRKGWKKADGQPVLNQDLLKALDIELAGREVSFEWVKGHSGHELNEAADQRARAAATAYQNRVAPVAGPGFRGSSLTAVQTDEAAPDLFSTVVPAAAEDELAVVIGFEKELLSDRTRSNTARVRQLLHPQFTEFGASGRIWTRNRLLAEIAPLPMRMRYEPIAAEWLSDDLVLLRWRAVSGHSEWLRSSIWQRHEGDWRLRFAQGTAVS